jgi:hypothetical protein
LASFRISEGSSEGVVTVSAAGGSIEQSIGMWLAQVGTQADDQRVSQVMDSAVEKETSVGVCKSYTVIAAPPADSDGPIPAIRVTVIPLDESESLYIKMSGDRELVESQSAAMDRFVDSLAW